MAIKSINQIGTKEKEIVWSGELNNLHIAILLLQLFKPRIIPGTLIVDVKDIWLETDPSSLS